MRRVQSMAPSLDSSDSLERASPYINQPLEPGQVRLLSLEWAAEPSLQHVFPWMSTPRSLQLRTFVRTLEDDTGDYVAVSYVWGTATASVRVMCNGTALFVTPNVYTMLEYLEPRRKLLWIDAICIDQINLDEKAAQIPLMHRVYTQSEIVVVWLGASDPTITIFMQNFPKVYKLAQVWVPKSHDKNDPYWRGPEWPPDDDPFWHGLFHLASHEWFERLWTFQEVVLAEEVQMIHGTSSIELGHLMNFWNRRFRGSSSHCYQPRSVMETLPDFSRTIKIFSDAFQTIRWGHVYRQDSGAGIYDLATIFMYTKCRRVKEAVDRIWAIVGILKEDFRNHLSGFVDYSEQARSQYWLTYILFAKAIYEKSGHCLALLNIPPSAEDDEVHLPSWCPRFHATEALCELLISWWWHYPVGRHEEVTRRWLSIKKEDEDENNRQCEAERISILYHPSKSVKMNGHDNIVNISGFVLDEMTEVVDGTGLQSRLGDQVFHLDENFIDPEIEKIRSFFLQSLALAQRTMGSTRDAISPIPQDFVMCLLCDCRVNMEANRACEDLLATCTSEGSKRHTLLDKARQEASSVLWMNVRQMIGHSFFATEGGRIGLATPGCRPGDKVCVFYGGEPLYILPAGVTGAGSRPVRFGGTAFIPHLMVQGERDATRLGDDETFSLC